MQTVYKSFLLDKIIIRQFIIVLILITLLFLGTSFKNYVNDNIENKNNHIDNRTVEIILLDKYNINDIQNNMIESIDYIENTNQYKIVLKNYRFVETFKEKYSNYYQHIQINSQNTGLNHTLNFLKKFLNIVLTLIIILLSIIIFLNICEVILNEQQEISFYKLVGYSNKDIFKLFSIIILSSYILLFIISFILYFIILKIINIIFSSILLKIIDLVFILKIFNLFFIIILISILITYLKIKKISPIKFQNIVS